MKPFKIFFLTTIGCLFTAMLNADIYEWTDEDGVRHFTNSAPPPEAKILMKTKEVPFDEAADRARRKAEQEVQLELARLEVAERTLELERLTAEAEERLAEADRKAEETLREAERLLNESRNESYEYRESGFREYYRGYYPYGYNNKYYYRNKTGSIYFKKRPYLKPHKRRYYKKYRYGYKDAYRGPTNHGKRYGYKKEYPRNDRYRSKIGNHRSRISIRSHSNRHPGRHYSGGIRSSSRARRH